MQQTELATDSKGCDASAIPSATPDEAVEQAATELDRFLTLLESFALEDWEKPTHCARWNVRQVVSHLAGATAIFANRDQVLERSEPWLQQKAEEPGQTMAVYMADLAGIPAKRRQAYREAGFNPLDTLTQFQVDERAQATPAELIAEVRRTGPAAITNRRNLPATLRSLQLPIGSGIKVPLQFFVDVILPRDMWMHRMEIALAVGRPIVRTPEHEGRLTALVMRDLSRRLGPVLGDQSIGYRLMGPDSGSFRFGPGEPAATLTMDTVDFHLLASGRLTSQEARSRSVVTIEGDGELAERVLGQTIVSY